MKKFFLICLAILLGVQGMASAKENEGLPETERIKIAVEVTSSSRYKELPTTSLLEDFLLEKLVEKNLISVSEPQRDSQPFDTNEKNFSVENIGELLIFDAIELPRTSTVPENFDADAYRELGAAYVIRCEVLGLGITKVDDNTISIITSIIGGGLSFAGNSNSNRDKTLRRVGTGIDMIGLIGMTDATKRTALNTVVNMQFISVETGEILWQENFTGQAIKHHKPNKNFDDAWTQAYTESVADSAKLIAKRVNKYVDKVIIKGKSDKSFLPKKFSLGGLNGGKLF